MFIAENGSPNLTFDPKVLLTRSSAIERLNIQFLQNVTHIEEDLWLNSLYMIVNIFEYHDILRRAREGPNRIEWRGKSFTYLVHVTHEKQNCESLCILQCFVLLIYRTKKSIVRSLKCALLS